MEDGRQANVPVRTLVARNDPQDSMVRVRVLNQATKLLIREFVLLVQQGHIVQPAQLLVLLVQQINGPWKNQHQNHNVYLIQINHLVIIIGQNIIKI